MRTRVEAELCRLPDGAQHPVVPLAPRHCHKPLRLQGVQANVQQGQACSGAGEGPRADEAGRHQTRRFAPAMLQRV